MLCLIRYGASAFVVNLRYAYALLCQLTLIEIQTMPLWLSVTVPIGSFGSDKQ